jgi:type IV fimbrial biogenesis protein FimT
MLNRSRQLGFTLIELVIVVAMFAILAAFAVPSYQQMIQNSQIRTATDSIVSGLQIARAEAVKRNTDVQFDFKTDSAWAVCVTPAGGGNCPATGNIQSRSVGEGSSSNVTINVNGTNSPYVFNGFGIMTSPTSALQIDIGNSALGSSRDLRVVVGTGGATKSCDPALDSAGSDPRRC